MLLPGLNLAFSEGAQARNAQVIDIGMGGLDTPRLLEQLPHVDAVRMYFEPEA
ncbi:conserved hypothetical protein [delta proteobacterium NaphS2]|nr:conserved hypothetical protein [delta proteobacterium NaphS2]